MVWPKVDFLITSEVSQAGLTLKSARCSTTCRPSPTGLILYGIREKGGVAEEIVGVGEINVEREILRLENLTRDALDPRVLGFEMRPIECDGSTVLAVRVPTSWMGPHMVTYRGSSRFWGRNSAGKYPLDVDELRVAFSQTRSVEERVERFRSGRLMKILAGETPAPAVRRAEGNSTPCAAWIGGWRC